MRRPLVALLTLWLVAPALLVSGPDALARAAAGVRPVPVPAAARPVDTSHPTRVIGHGTPAACTSAAVTAAVRAGGIIRFDCGPNPVTIQMNATAKVRNTSPRVVLDGGGLITLDGQGRHRILYMDTCDRAQVWTTSRCDDQATPQLIVQNIALVDGNSTGQHFDGGGGGAIFARGGRLRIVNSTFAGRSLRPLRAGPGWRSGAGPVAVSRAPGVRG